MRPPTTRERKALQNLGPRGIKPDMRAGEITIAALLAERWIERLPDRPSGMQQFRRTDLGDEALRLPPAPPKITRARIGMLKPQLGILDTRIAKPGPPNRKPR